MSTQRHLLGRHLKGLAPGKLAWIGLRPAHKQEMMCVSQVQALKDKGLEGDHRCGKTPGSSRQVTPISQEHIQLCEHLLTKEISPMRLRRNLVICDINLFALRHQIFSIGDAIFEGTAQCHPCSRMEKALGVGAVAALLGHSGMCAKIIKSGSIKIGDAVTLIHDNERQ